jgi:hypothetical protein
MRRCTEAERKARRDADFVIGMLLICFGVPMTLVLTIHLVFRSI